jgi:hypothetical protein
MHGEDVLGIPGMIVQVMPNLQHVLIDRADLAREVFSPGDAQEFILENDPTGVQHQGLEQLES